MRRNYLIAAALFSGLAFAQQPVQFLEMDATVSVQDGDDMLKREFPLVTKGAETVIWSEDFANGVPSSWTSLGFTRAGTPNPNAQWEYRGPATNPDTSTGSRGWLAGAGLPINSPTRANGFMIYDSDFKETGGTGIGNGNAAGGHIGVLITDTIDLSGEPEVVLEMYSYARLFNSRLYVAFSTNGGATYPDTIEIHPSSDLGVNTATPRDFRVLRDVSSFIGGQANVRMSIIFRAEERTGALSPNTDPSSVWGLYFWMIDDIALKSLPPTFFTFENTEVTTGTGTVVAPSYDILNDNPPTSWGGPGHYGITTLRQGRPVAFDANIRNFGSSPQSNVALAVEIWRNGVLDTVISHTPVPIMTPGQLLTFADFTTDFWTPTQKGDYQFVYKVTSDSLDLANNNSNSIAFRPDTIPFLVNDQFWGMDYRRFFNGLGTGQLGADGSAIAARYEVKEGQTDQMYTARIGLSGVTEAGAEIEVEVFKVEDFLTGGTGGAVAFAFKTITQAEIDNGFTDVVFCDPAIGAGEIDLGWTPQQQDSAYWIVVTMFSSQGNFPVSIRNDQTFQNTTQSLMFNATQGTWFNGYAGGSRSLAQPHIRMIACSSTDLCDGCGGQTNTVTEIKDELGIKYYPNPTSGIMVLDFGEKRGDFANIQITDMTGKVVHVERANTNNISQHQMNLSNLSNGLYLLNVEMGGKKSTYKVTVEK